MQIAKRVKYIRFGGEMVKSPPPLPLTPPPMFSPKGGMITGRERIDVSPGERLLSAH